MVAHIMATSFTYLGNKVFIYFTREIRFVFVSIYLSLYAQALTA